MTIKNIDVELANIFHKHTYIDFIEHKELRTMHFFSGELHIPARELVLILLDIQKNLGVKIPEEALINGQFSTFNSVKRIIEERRGDYGE